MDDVEVLIESLMASRAGLYSEGSFSYVGGQSRLAGEGEGEGAGEDDDNDEGDGDDDDNTNDNGGGGGDYDGGCAV